MTITHINNYFDSADRHKILVIQTDTASKIDCLSELKSLEIPVVNIGLELAKYLDTIDDYSFLEIEAIDFCKKLLEKQKTRVKNAEIPLLAIYNLGIMSEPRLAIKITSLIKEFSKTTGLIIVWEHEILNAHTLSWKPENPAFSIDLSKTAFKQIKYEI